MDRGTQKWLLAATVVGAAWFATTPKTAHAIARPKAEKYAWIWDLAHKVELKAGMPGFADFAVAVARRESRGNVNQYNDAASEARAACRLYENNVDTRFAENPYPAEDFCFGSGGLYGFLPATALSAPSFRESDPYLIFDPTAATVMLADFVRRIKKGFWHRIPKSCRNYATINRFMASNKVGLDCDLSKYQRSSDNQARFAKHLKALGITTSAMFRPVKITKWPGDGNLYHSLKGDDR